MLSKPLMQVAVPAVAVVLAFAVAKGTHERPAHELGMMDAGTPYSADHARIQQAAGDSDQPATF